jgi:flavin reductase (DIM6/NTAB) family NADH-FMN oxidoreductase RutF
VIIDPAATNARDMYAFLISAVVPRPIALVSTVGAAGGFNVAPFSYFNAISSEPPLLGISINRRKDGPKDTLRNIQDTGDFVVNAVPEALFEKMVQSSGDWPEEIDEFALTGLTPLPSDLVRAPRVAESPIHMECRVHRLIEFGGATLVVGEILRAHVADAVLTAGRVDPLKLKPVGRLGGHGYSIVRDVVQMERPRAERRPPA